MTHISFFLLDLKSLQFIGKPKAKMKIEHESIESKTKELQERNSILSKQSEDQLFTSRKIESERLKLQSMAEHLSQLSHELMMKSQSVDEKLARVEKMNSNIDNAKAMIMNEQVTLQHDRYSVMSCVEEINVMKMDVVRQRVQYLKEKFYNS